MQAPSGLSRVQGHRGVSAQWKLSSPAQPLSCSASQWLPLSHSLPLASHHRHRRQHQWEWPSRRSAQAASAAACVASAPAVPLVSEGWGLWALLALGGACAQVATRHAVGRALSTPLIALIYGVVLTATGVLPSDCVSFDVVWQYIMPLAAACFMLESDITQLAAVGGPTLCSFLVGAVGMVVGALAGWALLRGVMGPEGGKLAACLCASYVGGSVNFAAVAKAVALPASVVPAAMAVDNLAMAGFLAVLSAAAARDRATSSTTAPASTPSTASTPTATPTSTRDMARSSPAISATSSSGTHAASPSSSISKPASAPHTASTKGPTAATTLQTASPPSPHTSHTHNNTAHDRQDSAGPASQPAGADRTAVSVETASLSPPAVSVSPPAVTAESLALTFGAASLSCWLSKEATHALGVPSLHLLGMAVIASAFAALGPRVLPPATAPATAPAKGLSPFQGASALGNALMSVFFVVIGCSAGALSSLARPEALGMLLYLCVMVGVHWLVMAVANTVLRLPLPALVIGSNANIGGPATAAGMAASQGWGYLIQPAMLSGSAGYALGTLAGLMVARLSGVLQAL